jgi:hypothetical protein
MRLEDDLLRQIAEYEREHPGQEITIAKENEFYSIALETAIASDGGKTWASGNVRLGEFILLVDCDARVVWNQSRLWSINHFWLTEVTANQLSSTGALEMIESPDVAILQHTSSVMQVAHNLFENASKFLNTETLFDKLNISSYIFNYSYLQFHRVLSWQWRSCLC